MYLECVHHSLGTRNIGTVIHVRDINVPINVSVLSKSLNSTPACLQSKAFKAQNGDVNIMSKYLSAVAATAAEMCSAEQERRSLLKGRKTQ